MNRRTNTIWIVALLGAVALSALGCYFEDCPDEDEAERVEIEQGDYEQFFSIRRGTYDGAIPHPDNELHVRIISEDTVEVLHERDGEIVVETYGVTGRDIKVDFY